MSLRLIISLSLISLTLLSTGSVHAATLPGTSLNFQLIGHTSLFNRGMNAALAIFGHFVYIGSRSDGSDTCAVGPPTTTGCPHVHPGILIVDVQDPTSPQIVGEIGPPDAGLVFLTSRELRVIPQMKLLLVMTFQCSPRIHACQRPATASDLAAASVFNIKFFDLTDPVHPQLVSTYVPTSKLGVAVKPHEMFLWVDPKNQNRVLLFMSTPALTTDPGRPNLIITDISQARRGMFTEVAEGNWNNRYPGTGGPNYPFVRDANGNVIGCGPYDCNLFVHSMGVSADGKRAFLAVEAGHFLVLDTTAVATATSPGQVISLNGQLITDPTDRPVWLQNPPDPSAIPLNCTKNCPNSHSAVKVPGRNLALTTDEIYGTFTDPSFGCQWGWERLIDITNPSQPVIVGEFKIDENQPAFCGSAGDDPLTEQFTSFSSHNPTVTPHLAIVAWHSAGLQVSDLSNPTHPVQAGFFSPTPLDSVATEDMALSRGPNKVVMWSYPIIANGFIYVVDVRNGLYILQYTGPHADEIAGINFLEGNSNLGDFPRLEGL